MQHPVKSTAIAVSFDLFVFLCFVFAPFVFCLFLLCILVQLGYALGLFSRVYSPIPAFPKGGGENPSEFSKENSEHPGHKVSPLGGDLEGASIIICAKNEARNLERNLPKILSQRYSNEAGKPMYEVIVVNDASGDDTEQVLYDLSQRYGHLWSVAIAPDAPRDLPGKKYALSKGVQHASHNLLLLTDADCVPASDNWLALMVAPLQAGKEIVAGVGKYEAANGLLNAFIRWETLHSFLQWSCYAIDGKPYMAVGRNLACTKQALLKAQASEVWGKLPSGDDDLLVREVATADNTAIVCRPEAFTLSPAKQDWAAYVQQKQRHLSTGKYYKPGVKIRLGLYAVTHALSWILFFVLLSTVYSLPALVVMATRCVIYYMLWGATAARLGEKKTAVWFPLCDIGWLIYNFAFAPYITWKNKKQWT